MIKQVLTTKIRKRLEMNNNIFGTSKCAGYNEATC